MTDDRDLTDLFICELIYLILFPDEETLDKKITINDLIIYPILISSLMIMYNIDDIVWNSFQNGLNFIDYLNIKEKFKIEELFYNNNKLNYRVIYKLAEMGESFYYLKQAKTYGSVITISF